MIYCFDIDGVICHTEGTDYENAEPNWPVIERIKKLHEEGHEIRYYTGRGWGDSESHPWLSYSTDAEAHKRFAELHGMTEAQLDRWGLPVNQVHFKPPADVYVDDKGMNVREWWDGVDPYLPTVREMRQWSDEV